MRKKGLYIIFIIGYNTYYIQFKSKIVFGKFTNL